MKNNMTKNELLLFWGKWTSKIGDIIFDYVNSIIIVHVFSNSSWILALYQSSQTIINLIFNLLGGVISDAGKRKKILIITDLLSALVCFLTSFFVKSKYIAIILIIANALLALIFSFASPTYKSIVKEMVPNNRISTYNSIANAGVELISLVGPVIGLTMMNYFGAKGALLINAVTFAVSAFSESFLVRLENMPSNATKKNKKGILADIAAGFIYLKKEKTLFSLIVLSAMVNFFLAGYNLLIPYTDILFQSSFQNFYSKVMVAEAIGGIFGAFINSKLPHKITSKTIVLTLLLGATGISLVLPPLVKESRNLMLCLTPFFCFGITLTMYNINFMSYVQIHVDENYLGRIFSIIFTVAVMFMPIGSFVFSSIQIIDSVNGFQLVGTGIIILSILAIPMMFQKKV